MIHHERRCCEMLVRVRDFGNEYAADFPASSAGGRAFAEIKATVEELEEMGIHQASETRHATEHLHLKKTIARDNLHQSLTAIARAARAMAYESGGLEQKFRMPRGDNDQKLFASARAFAADAPAFKAQFLEYGLSEDFIERLNEEIITFNRAVNATNTADDTDSGTISAAVAPVINNAMNAVRKLNAIVRNKYCREPRKLAAWLIASHIEYDSSPESEKTSAENRR